MSDQKIIKDAKAELEAIRKYALEEATKQLDKRLEIKLKELDESISVQADGASINIDDNKIEVTKDDSTVTVQSDNSTIAPEELGMDEIPATDDTDDLSDDDIEEIYEIRSLNEDEEKMVVPNPFQEMSDKLDIIMSKLGATEPAQTDATDDGEVAIIDDETPVDADASVAPAPNPEADAQPQINEFNLEEYDDMKDNEDEIVSEIMAALAESGYELEEDADDDDTIDFDGADEDSDDLTIDTDDQDADDATKTVTITIDGDDCDCVVVDDVTDTVDDSDDDAIDFDVADDSDDDLDIDVSDDEDKDEEDLDETRGLGLGVNHRAGNRNRDTNNIEENKKITAQYESKLDELTKENKSLKSDIKEFENSFVELRGTIHEMQTFNAKLALANKLFLNGGLSTQDKVAINESLDKAETVKEAQVIYQKIVKNNNTVIKEGNVKNLLKSKTTKTVNSNPATGSQPLYESEESKTLKSRGQILAGIKKSED